MPGSWTADVHAGTVTHDSGLVVRFTPAGDAGAFDGRIVGSIPASLPRDPQKLSLLMREAGDAYIKARGERH